MSMKTYSVYFQMYMESPLSIAEGLYITWNNTNIINVSVTVA